MTEQKILNKIIEDLVENRAVFNDMKEDLSFIVRENDNGNDLDWTYDQFCLACLEKIKQKDLTLNEKVKTVKDHFLDSMIEIVIDELKKRGRIEQSEKLKEYLNGNIS